VLAIAAGLRAGPHSWPPVVAVLVILAGLLLAAERTLPGHRLLPHWGHAGDLLHTVTAALLIPAVVWQTGLYEHLRMVHL
jgi:hypothetical protein